MNTFRIHIRPKGGQHRSKFSFNYCLAHKVLGVGWQTKTQRNGLLWEDYEREASEIHGSGDLTRVRYLKNRVRKDDLIWTRDTEGHYYLAKADSGWEYYTNDEAQQADIVNVVRCDIRKVESVDQVPGKIIACFRPTRAIQAIADATAVEYSKLLWNRITKTDFYVIPKDAKRNIFSYLDAEATEDVIFIYLQTKGWLVIPNSRKGDTMTFEFYAINKMTKARGLVQVKTGHTPLNRDDYKNRSETIFLFQSAGAYNGDEVSGVYCLTPEEIESFMFLNREIMPANIGFWLDEKDGVKGTAAPISS